MIIFLTCLFELILLYSSYPQYTGNIQIGTLANTEDPDEMVQNVLHHSQHFFSNVVTFFGVESVLSHEEKASSSRTQQHADSGI